MPDLGRTGSVRVNLSIPAEQDAVLADLAKLTGRGKASFAAEALSWYLPHLLDLAQTLRDRKAAASVGAAGEGSGDPEGRLASMEASLGVKLSRDERRRLVRELRSRGGGGGEG